MRKNETFYVILQKRHFCMPEYDDYNLWLGLSFSRRNLYASISFESTSSQSYDLGSKTTPLPVTVNKRNWDIQISFYKGISLTVHSFFPWFLIKFISHPLGSNLSILSIGNFPAMNSSVEWTHVFALTRLWLLGRCILYSIQNTGWISQMAIPFVVQSRLRGIAWENQAVMET